MHLAVARGFIHISSIAVHRRHREHCQANEEPSYPLIGRIDSLIFPSAAPDFFMCQLGLAGPSVLAIDGSARGCRAV